MYYPCEKHIAGTKPFPVIKHYQAVPPVPRCRRRARAGGEAGAQRQAQRPGVQRAGCVLDAAAAPQLNAAVRVGLTAAGWSCLCDVRLPLARARRCGPPEQPPAGDAAAGAGSLEALLAACGCGAPRKREQRFAATRTSGGAEFLDYKLLLCVVADPAAALAHIAPAGAAAIPRSLCKDAALAERFLHVRWTLLCAGQRLLTLQ